jgi:hypothetical protein
MPEKKTAARTHTTAAHRGDMTAPTISPDNRLTFSAPPLVQLDTESARHLLAMLQTTFAPETIEAAADVAA